MAKSVSKLIGLLNLNEKQDDLDRPDEQANKFNQNEKEKISSNYPNKAWRMLNCVKKPLTPLDLDTPIRDDKVQKA